MNGTEECKEDFSERSGSPGDKEADGAARSEVSPILSLSSLVGSSNPKKLWIIFIEVRVQSLRLREVSFEFDPLTEGRANEATTQVSHGQPRVEVDCPGKVRISLVHISFTKPDRRTTVVVPGEAEITFNGPIYICKCAV